MPRAERRSARSRSSLADAETRAREARQRALREGNAGRPAIGARYARTGLRQLDWTENGRRPDARQVHEQHYGLAAKLLGTLAQWESELGRTEYAFHLLDHAERLTAADDRGILLLQRGLILMRTGRERDALKVLDDAVSALKGNPAETAGLASALLNRTFAYLSLGQVREARTNLVSVPPRRDGWGPRPDRGQDAAQPGLLRPAGRGHPGRAAAVQRGRRRIPAERSRLSPRAGDRQGRCAARRRARQRRSQ